MIYPQYESQIQALNAPNHKTIKESYFVGFEEFSGTKKEIEALEEEIIIQARLAFEEARKKHFEHYNNIRTVFAANLSSEYGTDNPVVDKKIYVMAWDKGRSSGSLSDVEAHYMELSDLALLAFDEGKKTT